MDEVEWIANEECLKTLLEMGFTKDKAELALMRTGNYSVELAAAFLVSDDIPKDSINELKISESQNDSSEDEWEDVEESYKMVFIVNTELNMSIGKTAAQVAHGALGIYRDLMKDPKHQKGLLMWSEIGEKKIVLVGKNHEELLDLQWKATNLGLPSHLIRDAGHTEVAPNAVTVLALFGRESNVDRITGNLRLLK